MGGSTHFPQAVGGHGGGGTNGHGQASRSFGSGAGAAFSSSSSSAPSHFLPPPTASVTHATSSSNSHSNSSSTHLPANLNLNSAGSAGAVPGDRSSKARCTRVALAGSGVSRGRKNSSFAKVACNSLRCLQCNFKVLCFAGSSWDESTDYMFLRNNVPNEAKLAQKLSALPAACAYCCQCSHVTVAGAEEVLELGVHSSHKDPQWTCAGH
jgi:hypothetical protein